MVILPFFFFSFGTLTVESLAILVLSRELFALHIQTLGCPVWPLRVPGVLDKAREDPLCGTHALPLISVQPLSCLDCHGWTISFSPEVSSFLHFCLWVSKHFLNSPSLERRCCRSVAQAYATLWDPMDYSTPGLPFLTISLSLPMFMSIASVLPSSHLIP